MSNKLIVLWGFIIVSLVLSIYILGVTREKEIGYISLKEEIKESTNKYISDNDIKLPLEITSEELENDGYIKKLKLEDKTCTAKIKVYKKYFIKKYDIDFKCINEEAN